MRILQQSTAVNPSATESVYLTRVVLSSCLYTEWSDLCCMSVRHVGAARSCERELFSTYHCLLLETDYCTGWDPQNHQASIHLLMKAP